MLFLTPIGQSEFTSKLAWEVALLDAQGRAISTRFTPTTAAGWCLDFPRWAASLADADADADAAGQPLRIEDLRRP